MVILDHNISLLELLLFRASWACLSDLHTMPKQMLVAPLHSIPVNAFPEKEWADAVEYLTGERFEGDCSSAKQYLLEYVMG